MPQGTGCEAWPVKVVVVPRRERIEVGGRSLVIGLPRQHISYPYQINFSCSRATLMLCKQRRKMSNLTIVVDKDTLKRARIRALEGGTSVNVVLREFLETYAGVRREQREALQRILDDARKGGTGSGPGGRKWTREELYDREGLRE